ncbi:transmembrane protein 143-like [Babylonia areolata]|uniref:transmembrane protein 143-like n=1 Tax=Babylonia areolata TaxID=304850 RepID=UPI003FD5DA4E
MAASFLREAGVWGPYFVRCVSSKTWLGGARHCVCRIHLLRQRHGLVQTVRTAATVAIKGENVTVDAASKGEGIKAVQPVLEVADPEDLYRERYIPITRRSIIRMLMEQDDLLTGEEKKCFDDFALALDSAIVNKYHGILQQLKLLFDPINPDKDTVQTRKVSRREKLDNEFWLLQQLEDVMEKANFFELEKSQVLKFLEEHEAQEGVRVSVNPDRYDILRFWVLGREQPEPEPNVLQRLINRALRRPVKPSVEYYKRVVVAIRLKKDSKLMLKAFKEIPVNNLEMLLPDGTIRMNTFDKSVLASSVFIATAGLVAKVVTVLASVNFDWMLLVTLVMGGVGVRAWTVYKNRRNAYLVDMSRTLYFKNVANNRGLLALLVDRAEDESFKEALLAYTFLLTSRPPPIKRKVTASQVPVELGGLSDAALESKIEQWIESKTGVQLEFESSEAIRLLKSFGILSESTEKLSVLPLESALRCLPITPQSLIARSSEADITEGYDRDEYLETEHEYKEEEKRSSRFGWL